MNFTFKTEGFDELARALNALPEAVGKKMMREALKRAAQPIAGMARAIMARSPDAPHAAENIVIHPGRSGFSVAIGPSQDGFHYWMFQEFGTRFQSPQPAMRPAFDSQAPAALGIMGRELWQALAADASRQVRGVGGRYV